MKAKLDKQIDKAFLKEKSKLVEPKDVDKLYKKRNRLKRILNLKVFSKQKDKLKLLLELTGQYKNGKYRNIPWRSMAAITFTLLYIINPLDIIPDVLPVIGYVDDMSVFMALYNLIDKDIEDYKDWKSLQDI
jgi:uncharacterized membrane protein YkvA (DUF1232 family)